jgi:hypothetical protein
MRTKQIPSKDTFLVRTAGDRSEAASKRLASLGKIEPAESAGGVIVRLNSTAADPKAAWENVKEKVGEIEVDPILLDESGEPHYPTGEVTVRFKEPPTEAFLSNFAEKYGLKVRSRNKYVPAQVAFTVAGQRYLPELVEQLKQADNAVSAWANTLSRYRRA